MVVECRKERAVGDVCGGMCGVGVHSLSLRPFARLSTRNTRGGCVSQRAL